jgi:hypothetical protein
LLFDFPEGSALRIRKDPTEPEKLGKVVCRNEDSACEVVNLTLFENYSVNQGTIGLVP